MKKRLALVTTLFTATALALGAVSHAKDANSVLKEAQQAMGTVKSIQYSGTGMSGFFGQALIAGKEWPRRDLAAYTRTINYEQRSARDELTFTQPVFGGLQQNTQVNGDKAWNVGPNGPVPQLAAAEDRQLQIWLTPHGFVNGALAAGNATVKSKGKLDIVTFTALGKYQIEGVLDAQHRLAQVGTTIANPVLGDTVVAAEYSDYRSYDGVQFPGKILIIQGGHPTWDLKIDRVTANAPFDLPVPAAVASATIPPVQVVSNKLADGVWHLTGGSHHSVLVEFKDYVAVVEAPQDETRSLAVLAEVQKLVPTKPVSYVLTTHHHFDHSGGLRTYVARGATVVTHQTNVAYFQNTLMAPATIVPDAQSKNRKRAKLQGVKDKYVLTDGTQTIEVYATAGDTHTGEYTLVYLPGPKILVEGDAYSPGPAGAPPPATPPPNAVMLHNDLERLKLDVAVIAPIHGRGAVPMDEMKKALGKT
jgi:glyoxylase-like metal-dependent hydrolase (beta-lactamase superfamily II)